VRFDERETLSTGLGPTMSGGACDATFSGPLLGYWTSCPEGISFQQSLPVSPAVVARYRELERSGHAAAARKLLCSAICAPLRRRPDESVEDRRARQAAVDYISTHRSRFVFAVVPARIGRIWNVFRPLQNARFDNVIEGRGRWPSYLALGAYWILLPLSIVGLVDLRRRRRPISPYLVLCGIVTLGAAVSFGIQRYRVPVDAVLPVLAAVGSAALLNRLRDRRALARIAP
jgi:hypothetical protein